MLNPSPSGGPVFRGKAFVFLVLFLSPLLSGCYVLKQGGVMLGYQYRAVPIDSLLADPGTSEDTREFLRQVKDIKNFAILELGLKEDDNYTTYVELDRDYLASVVSASAKDAFVRHEWWFPVVGRVPYKGFFSEEDAGGEAEKLKKKDLDVWVRRVDAFSTLGWFSDPLYSYMKNDPPHRIADLLIHEQTHATVFLKNEVQFNEELAGFVGREGARLYIEKTYGRDSPEYRAIENQKADSAAYIAFIQELIDELDGLYKTDAPRREKLAGKERIIAAAKKRFEAGYSEMFRGDGYKGFLRLPVNNAYLELFRLYHGNDGYFEDLYERSSRSLPRLIAAAKTLKSGRNGPKAQLEEALGLGQGGGSRINTTDIRE
jgi:predicted aminopeptidase